MSRAFLAVVSPSGALSATRRYWGMVAHLLGEIAVLFVQPNVFKSLALQTRTQDDKKNEGDEPYKHRVERLRNATDCRRVVRHRKSCHERYPT